MTTSKQDATHEFEVGRSFVLKARDLLRAEYLPKLKHCLESLTDEQVWWRPNAESNSIGNLLLHLSGNARQWVVSGLGGQADQRRRQSEFDEREMISARELLAALEQTLAEVDRVLTEFDVDRILVPYEIQGTRVTALEAIFHVTEHFSMHTGQIILLTKMLAATDLHFYGFEGSAPVPRWRSDPS